MARQRTPNAGRQKARDENQNTMHLSADELRRLGRCCQCGARAAINRRNGRC